MFYQLPPVGNPVCLSHGNASESLLQDIFHPYDPEYYASGTAALAASIIAAIRLKGVDNPEVILPAYGCPDLVSAAVFAGARPILADLEPDRPWMDLSQVSGHITTNTVAIIAASLCGIPERLDALRQIAEANSVLLIEDSAQAFPGSSTESFWQGDLVVLSFGRGKPVSMLGGGAVLSKDRQFARLLPEQKSPRAGYHQHLAFQMKVGLYNALISPYLYWIPQALPFLRLGETQYHPLDSIRAMDPEQQHLLAANVERYLERDTGVQASLADIIGNLDSDRVIDLPVICSAPQKRRLLRYPLLVESGTLSLIYKKLRHSGLGPSRMYPAPLPGIPGLEHTFCRQGPFPVAQCFADRLLTLPTHVRVTQADVGKISALMA
jgi:dTDP-4-amino-4,6-dideoxygalactose transaminase